MELRLFVLLLLSGCAAANNCTEVSTDERVACFTWWKWDLSVADCHARECCWGPSDETINWCYYPHDKLDLSVIHVIQGCHLDVGFAETAPDIVNLWFDHHFPLAIQIGRELENQTGPARLHFTAQSWLVSLYIDCPAEWALKEGVHCPNATALADFNEGVEKGWITWHAFPFNAEPEFMDASLVAYGVDLTHSVDSSFGLPPKITMSQRDVPGMTRSIIPVLRSQGVTTLSVGVNGGSTPPNVPRAFIWKDPNTNTSVRTLYVNGGYGGVNNYPPGHFEVTIIPGFNQAVIIDWRGDNAGPPTTAASVVQQFADIQKQFPHAKILASTFDIFANALATIPEADLPVITSEIGDTWIHGVTSDPVKTMAVRHAQKLRTECLHSGACSPSDPRIGNFSRFLLKNGEHTWGLDVKSTIKPPSYQHTNWANAEFERVLPTPMYQTLEESWVRQRRWGMGDAVDALLDHPLAQQITDAWAALVAQIPSTTGMQRYSPSSLPTFQCGRFSLAFDHATGAMAHLTDSVTGGQWNPATGGLAEFVYRTYDAEEYTAFMLDYNYLGPLFPLNDKDDFDKVGISTGGAKARLVSPTLVSVFAQNTTFGNTSDPATKFLVELSMPSEVVSLAGAPASAWVAWVVPWQSTNIQLTVQVFNKTKTRLPEAMFLRFRPASPAQSAACSWSMEKLGLPLDPFDVVVGGSKNLHAVSQGGITVTCPTQAGHHASLAVLSSDATVVRFGEPSAFPIPTTQTPDPSQGAAYLLWSNLWNTNYIMWFPFNPSEANIKYEFAVQVSAN